MKKDIKNLKPVKGMGEDKPSSPLPPGTLYVVCKNRPLINLWQLNNRYSCDHYDISETNLKSDYAMTRSSFQKDDMVSALLSLEEEMLLYNDGLSDNY